METGRFTLVDFQTYLLLINDSVVVAEECRNLDIEYLQFTYIIIPIPIHAVHLCCCGSFYTKFVLLPMKGWESPIPSTAPSTAHWSSAVRELSWGRWSCIKFCR